MSDKPIPERRPDGTGPGGGGGPDTIGGKLALVLLSLLCIAAAAIGIWATICRP